jgi:hypothetical protein
MTCEACDKNIVVWSVCVDDKRNTAFGVCEDCFDEHKVCWTSFERNQMDNLYLVVGIDYEWEDMKIFDNEHHAIEYSKKYPQIRIEIFKKNGKSFLEPTYMYYQNGKLHGE